MDYIIISIANVDPDLLLLPLLSLLTGEWRLGVQKKIDSSLNLPSIAFISVSVILNVRKCLH